MTEQIVHRLQEQLTEAHMRLAEYTKKIDSMQTAAEQARAVKAELPLVQQERDRALAAKGAAEKAAVEARERQRQAEREAASARDDLEKERALLAAVRTDASRLSALNARISRSQHIEDLFAQEQ